MLDSSTLAIFLAASLAFLLIPGPTAMYIVARGIHQGRSAALVSILGVEVGTLIQVLAATLGVSALMASSTLAFSVVKYLGVFYLVWLGIRTLRDRGMHFLDEAQAPVALTPVFLQGVLVEALNPETALFFMAFLPQFVDTARGPVAWQMLTLGLLFVLLATCNDGVMGLLASTLGGRLRDNAKFLRVGRFVSGSVYLSLAASTALANSSMH